MSNREYRVRPQIISNEPIFSPFSISMNKCSCSCCKVGCNNINDPYAQLCVPDVVKNINVKVLNLMSRTSETRHVEGHESCKCKCRLDAQVFNNK